MDYARDSRSDGSRGVEGVPRAPRLRLGQHTDLRRGVERSPERLDYLGRPSKTKAAYSEARPLARRRRIGSRESRGNPIASRSPRDAAPHAPIFSPPSTLGWWSLALKKGLPESETQRSGLTIKRRGQYRRLVLGGLA